MAKKEKVIPLEERIDTSPEGLAKLRMRFRPVGSGPLGTMKYVVALINLLSEEKGIDLDEVEFESPFGSQEGVRFKGWPPRKVEE